MIRAGCWKESPSGQASRRNGDSTERRQRLLAHELAVSHNPVHLNDVRVGEISADADGDRILFEHG